MGCELLDHAIPIKEKEELSLSFPGPASSLMSFSLVLVAFEMGTVLDPETAAYGDTTSGSARKGKN
jgi:hypothetical protein